MTIRISKRAARSFGIVAAVGQVGSHPDTLRRELVEQIRLAGLAAPQLEVRASDLGISDRSWRYDLGWRLGEYHWLLVEIQGGLFAQGAHSRGAGIERDIEKLNAAQLAGHVMLQCSTGHIKSGMALLWIDQALKG